MGPEEHHDGGIEPEDVGDELARKSAEEGEAHVALGFTDVHG